MKIQQRNNETKNPLYFHLNNLLALLKNTNFAA